MKTAYAPIARGEIGPGEYHNLPEERYHALKYASHSYLCDMKRSPAHCLHSMTCGREATPALLLGRAIHFAVLQPDLFRDRYTILPEGDGRSAEVKAARAEARRLYGEDNLLSRDDFQRCIAVRDAVWSHPRAKALLAARTDTEISGVWDDEPTGIRCKLRSDFLCRGGVIGDLKTTENASRREFEKAIFRWSYYMQGAFYHHGWAKLRQPQEHFCIIAVEKSPPHGVCVYRLEDDALAEGDNEFRALLVKFAECQQSGEWPGYSNDFERIGLPRWAASLINGEGA